MALSFSSRARSRVSSPALVYNEEGGEKKRKKKRKKMKNEKEMSTEKRCRSRMRQWKNLANVSYALAILLYFIVWIAAEVERKKRDNLGYELSCKFTFFKVKLETKKILYEAYYILNVLFIYIYISGRLCIFGKFPLT